MKKAFIPLVLAVVVLIGAAGFWLGQRSAVSNLHPEQGATESSAANSPTAPSSALSNNAPVKRTSSTAANSIASAAQTSEPAKTASISNTTSNGHPIANSSSQSSADAEMQKRISAKFEELDSENPDSAFQSPNVAAHQLVLTQAEDPDWSPVVDQALADRLNADLGGQFNVASIDCRTDICELRVSGYTPMDAEDNFQKDIYELQHQGWFNTYGLHLENFMMSGVGNGGPSLFIVYLTRK